MSNHAIVSKRPICDVHKARFGDSSILAKYDAKSVGGPWANMCEECFQQVGIKLGTGFGQLLVVRGEQPS